MTSAQELAKRVREVFLDGTWIAYTNYHDQLIKTSWEAAQKKPNPLNSVAALTYHVNYYLEGLLHFFNTGDLLIKDKYSFDHPDYDNEEDWLNLIQSLKTNAERFAEAVENMSDTKLNSTFVDPRYGTYRRNIEGVIEHSYYHLGQIVLIRKLIVSM